MELKEFIAQTINEICEGISIAGHEQNVNSCPIAPKRSNNSVMADDLTKIHFELAVEVEENSQKNGKAAIKVLSMFSAAGGKDKAESIKNINKISFDVPFAPQFLGSKPKKSQDEQ
jgi:hypothetical protein